MRTDRSIASDAKFRKPQRILVSERIRVQLPDEQFLVPDLEIIDVAEDANLPHNGGARAQLWRNDDAPLHVELARLAVVVDGGEKSDARWVITRHGGQLAF